MLVFQLLFWSSIVIIVYHYCGSPIVTAIIAMISEKKINKRNITPFVSLIIAAYNEEKVIEQKINNSFLLDYPQDKMEIIVVSDGSTDLTPKIVEKFNLQGVISLYQPLRQGKTAALNRAIAAAKGEIIVFSDANSMYEKKAIATLVANFNDPSIGGVCGRKSILINDQREASQGDSLFWDYESRLKIMQSRAGSISNGDGEIFAIRKHLYSIIPEDLINDDQEITFNIINHNFRVVYEPMAVSFEEASIFIEDDFRVKARMIAGGYQIISRYKDLLIPPRTLFAFQFFSHKILRYVMPFVLLLLLLSNLFLLEGVHKHFLLLQLFFYLMAMIGYIMKILGNPTKVFYIPYYYCAMNIAALLGFYYFFRSRDGVSVWKKAIR